MFIRLLSKNWLHTHIDINYIKIVEYRAVYVYIHSLQW